MKKIFVIVLGLLLVAVSVHAAWQLPSGQVLQSPKRVKINGKKFKVKWFYQPQRLIKHGVKYWTEVLDFDQRYYKSTGYTDDETTAPNGVQQIIRTHTFTEKSSVASLKLQRLDDLDEVIYAVSVRKLSLAFFNPYLTNAEMHTALTVKRAEILARKRTLANEINLLTTYTELAEYQIVYEKVNSRGDSRSE